MASKPWRTVIISKETGRFTRKEIERAVEVAKAETERKKARRGSSSSGRPSPARGRRAEAATQGDGTDTRRAA